jgi:tyrosyl-tRNA synthetase
MNIDEQVEYFMQGTEYGDELLKQNMAKELKERLEEGRPLRVYCGFDPRKADLHLGHTVPMRKLRQFQELGHEVTFLIGNYTSLIGDPSDKDVLRPQLTHEEVEYNSKTYVEQAFRILDPKKTNVRYNAEWLSGLTFEQLIKLASNFTVQQFLTRENFKLRWENKDAVYLHETFYSIMQGYDAYALNADVQIGGTDQLFNIMTAGRKIMTSLGSKPNIAIILGILPGTDGVVKMSKSLGNHIPINTNANDMFGKVMSIPDLAVGQFFRLTTKLTPQEILGIEDKGMHPKDMKIILAQEVVKAFYGDSDSESAKQIFIDTFCENKTPEDIANFNITEDSLIINVLFNSGMTKSKNEAKRLITQGGVKFNNIVVDNMSKSINGNGVLQIGSRRFLKINKTNKT